MKILIVGKGASGKDTLGNSLIGKGLKRCVFSTSRPKRANEVDGEHYFFTDEKASPDDILVEDSYNGWNYSLTKWSWEKGDFAIFTPSYLKQLSKEAREQCFVIYLDTPESIRKERLSKRGDADTVDRRLKTDEEDFSGFTDYDIILRDWNFGGQDCDFIADTLFSRALHFIKSCPDVEAAKEAVDKEWGSDGRSPLPNESVESYVISRLHTKLGSVITIQENGTYLFVYLDQFSKKLRTVGNCSLDVASESLFEGLSKTMFRKVREAQLQNAESFVLIQTIFDSYAFGSLPKRIQESIRGYLGKGVPKVLSKS